MESTGSKFIYADFRETLAYSATFFVNKCLTEFHEKPANGAVADTCSQTDGVMDGCGKRI